jgi:glutathione transport system ATP-binding protein
MGVIFITHDMGVVAEIADEVMEMRSEVTVERGMVERVFARPEHPYTRNLLAAVPMLGAMNGMDRPAKFQLIEPAGAEIQAPDLASMSAAAATGIPPDYASRPLLRVRNLVTRYDIRGGIFGAVQRRVHAVEDVTFDLFAGETLALVGESGCGKSTTARAVARLLQTQGGEIEFNGDRIDTINGSRLKAVRRQIQMVFQDPYASLDPRRTVEDSLLEPLTVHGIARGEQARRRAAELLRKVGLSANHAHRYPHEFSGGQRQRICIARALALSPKLIVADESVSALDVSIQAQVINLMQDLQREMGIAFLFISHDLAVVERISHRVAVMYLGRIVEMGSRRQVFENPRHPYTRKLMSAVPVADPSRRRTRQLLDGDIPSPVHGVGYVPPKVSFTEVSPGHFVAADASA